MRLFFRALRSFMKPGGLVKAGHLKNERANIPTAARRSRQRKPRKTPGLSRFGSKHVNKLAKRRLDPF